MSEFSKFMSKRRSLSISGSVDCEIVSDETNLEKKIWSASLNDMIRELFDVIEDSWKFYNNELYEGICIILTDQPEEKKEAIMDDYVSLQAKMVIKNLKDYEGFVESLFKVDESNPELVKIVYMNFSKDKLNKKTNTNDEKEDNYDYIRELSKELEDLIRKKAFITNELEIERRLNKSKDSNENSARLIIKEIEDGIKKIEIDDVILDQNLDEMIAREEKLNDILDEIC